jgi:hypothetical protein
MSKQDQLVEYIIRDVIEYYVLDEKAEMKDAIALFYDSKVFAKLNDVQTGLYLNSSAYVYDLFRDELRNGRIVQNEI